MALDFKMNIWATNSSPLKGFEKPFYKKPYFHQKNRSMEVVENGTFFEYSREILDHYHLHFKYEEFVQYNQIEPLTGRTFLPLRKMRRIYRTFKVKNIA